MKKFISGFIVSLSIVTSMMGVAAVVTPAANAASTAESICIGSGGKWTADNKAASGGVCSSSDNRTVVGTIQNITDVLVFITGAVAVLMIVIGGIRYVTSGGDQNSVTGAKNTIMYALIGVSVAAMAYAIVHFVLGALGIK